MSFIDDIVELGSDVMDFARPAIGFLGGNGIGSVLARTALMGVVLNQLNSSVNKDNTPSAAASANEVDKGARLSVEPNTEHKIPVVYGTAVLGGIITDAQISNNNTKMTYVITISEQTGRLLSDTSPSTITFDDIYIDDKRCVFYTDGLTVNYTVDKDGYTDYSMDNLVRVYCFNGSSLLPTRPNHPSAGYSTSALGTAYSIVPTWTSSYAMNELIFAVVEVNYNRDRGVTAIPTMKFKLTNSMTQPGDCLYDYLTNTRYGAGIDPTEIST
jgi:hypothetical protein